ncbi:bifunctional diguanylate cyclase/phosphodiesterase [Pseudomonas sp. DWP3-1-2]|uniref:sensor domain-containing phosphodiesterase n=1 Tax=Pseudomonas sp. DWP3-1-2 TaxID=2804645 RepID=UPI003CF26DD9
MHQTLEKEQQRLAAVRALQWLETANNENFDRICRLASAYFDVPTVLVSLVEEDRQWFPARVGFAPSETPISQSFCAHTLRQQGVMQVVNACEDVRFATNELVTAQDGIRFYAGAPLLTREGIGLGSLCIIDKLPHQLNHAEIQVLKDLAEMVISQIEQRQMVLTRNPVSGLPNLRQFLADHQQSWCNAQFPARLLALIEIVDSQYETEPDSLSAANPLQMRAQDIAGRLEHALQTPVTVYHISERHCCVLLSANPAQRCALIQTLITLICEPCAEDSISALPATRLGIACCQEGSQSIGDLLRNARLAVEAAERNDKGWAVWDETEDCANRRAHMLSGDVAAALSNGEFYLVYQPRFRLEDGRQVSAEALLRWNHSTLGPVSPTEFIPLIERSGQISTVTRWVIEHALAAAAEWEDKEAKVSLNLSALDFQSIDIAGALRASCEQHSIAPQRVEVEITEGEWIRASSHVLVQLSDIRALGVDVAIDDFGTGYSNFAYLHEIPANVIKLDKSIITDLENKPRNRIIAQSIFKLAHELGYRTVAEGIETFQCMDMVRSYGCDEAQGFFFCRPMSGEQIKRLNSDSAIKLRT